MINEQVQLLSSIYSRIADNLNISSAMTQKAITSYEAIGKWLGDCDPAYDIKIMPQGSFNLGTVIKPLSDKDDGYDIDLVCLLKNGQMLDLYSIKNIVGRRLKENGKYKLMLDTEGKRCWTLNYDEFHMDILPCIPNQILFIEPNRTEIKLTNKLGTGAYEPRYSNPYKYRNWFEERMKTILLEAKQQFAIRNKIEISKVPTSSIRTPLQQAVQLLKRHRDKMFEKNNEDAPISIIITTLAAHAYNNEPDVYSALKSILNGMSQ